ncbi:MAG: hypothetical protein DMF63_14460 [Acidobacteria bacterium]|nr:MAG: hypothetical protein DMF63_14460 [Acidobacteriota bacterium]
MTVCIAALYETNKNSRGIAFATDWQDTDLTTGVASQTGLKITNPAGNVMLLGAGDLPFLGQLAEHLRIKTGYGVLPDVAAVVKDYKELYRGYLNVYLEDNVLNRHNYSWGEWKQKSEDGSISSSLIEIVNRELTRAVPPSVDAIIAGIDKPNTPEARTRLVKITRDPLTGEVHDDDVSHRGHAEIGEGDFIADLEFRKASFHRFGSKKRTVFLSYLAKRRAGEVYASVGSNTGLYTLDHEGGMAVGCLEFKKEFDKIYNALSKKAFRSGKAAYDKAETIFDRVPFDKTPRQKRR